MRKSDSTERSEEKDLGRSQYESVVITRIAEMISLAMSSMLLLSVSRIRCAVLL